MINHVVQALGNRMKFFVTVNKEDLLYGAAVCPGIIKSFRAIFAACLGDACCELF